MCQRQSGTQKDRNPETIVPVSSEENAHGLTFFKEIAPIPLKQGNRCALFKKTPIGILSSISLLNGMPTRWLDGPVGPLISLQVKDRNP